ncbi:MAG TPA: phosphopantetheine-binding protein [Herpetosiphonaceae bacterium]
MTIAQQISEILTEQFQVPADRLAPDANIQHDLGLEPPRFQQLIQVLEDTFQLSLRDQPPEGLQTLGALIARIEVVRQSA